MASIKYKTDISWLQKQAKRWMFRTNKDRRAAADTLHELLVSRQRLHDMAVEIQCWRDATKVGQIERHAYSKARLMMSERGVIPVPLQDDDFKRAPND